MMPCLEAVWVGDIHVVVIEQEAQTLRTGRVDRFHLFLAATLATAPDTRVSLNEFTSCSLFFGEQVSGGSELN